MMIMTVLLESNSPKIGSMRFYRHHRRRPRAPSVACISPTTSSGWRNQVHQDGETIQNNRIGTRQEVDRVRQQPDASSRPGAGTGAVSVGVDQKAVGLENAAPSVRSSQAVPS